MSGSSCNRDKLSDASSDYDCPLHKQHVLPAEDARLFAGITHTIWRWCRVGTLDHLPQVRRRRLVESDSARQSAVHAFCCPPAMGGRPSIRFRCRSCQGCRNGSTGPHTQRGLPPEQAKGCSVTNPRHRLIFRGACRRIPDLSSHGHPNDLQIRTRLFQANAP